MSTLRIGIGVDFHRTTTDRHRTLVLGGVAFEGEPALEGHSDADLVAHAVADAMLGAAGLGDLGDHFPDDDDRYVNADSLGLLHEVRSILAAAGLRVCNVDCTVVAGSPRLSGHRAEMAERLGQAAGGPVHVKATSPERLGALGRLEGLACVAVALVDQVNGARLDG
jgi:2-C-methyl-D-erythritol 2,4-cyclodiphosphate synthase